MSGDAEPEAAWFAGVDPNDLDGLAAGIVEGRADAPADWPELAVEAGFAGSQTEYYERLHAACVRAAREEAHARALAGDQQVIEAVRAMDDCARTANELAERLSEWAGGYYDESGGGLGYAREVAGRTPETEIEERLVRLAELVEGLDGEREALRGSLEREVAGLAPNLAALAGPVLGARLIALAGGLEALAKKPSGTIQVLGAENALFAHLRGNAPAPKHGVIYTHEYVRGTHRAHRGSAARALAGKLAIAARIDHYSGDPNPDLERELAERIARIRAREEGES